MVLCTCSDQDIMCYLPQSKTEWLPTVLQVNDAYLHKILRAGRWTFLAFEEVLRDAKDADDCVTDS